jgi:hypothetical protein
VLAVVSALLTVLGLAFWQVSDAADRSHAALAGPTTGAGPTPPTTSASPGRSTTATPRATATSPRGTPTGIVPPNPVTSGWPDASSTGIPKGTGLTRQSNTYYKITRAGTVINGWDFAGQVEIRANNVTIKNSRVHCTDACVTLAPGYRGMVLSHDDIGLDSGWGQSPIGVIMGGMVDSPTAVDDNILQYLHIHNVGDGLRVEGNVTVRYNYIHALDMTGDGAHSDGVQTFGGPWALFFHNTIEGGNTSDILVQGGASSNWVIDDNLLLGRRDSSSGAITSFAIGFDNESCPKGGCKFVHNKVNRTWESDVSYDAGPWNAGNWYGNTFVDNGETVPVPR